MIGLFQPGNSPAAARRYARRATCRAGSSVAPATAPPALTLARTPPGRVVLHKHHMQVRNAQACAPGECTAWRACRRCRWARRALGLRAMWPLVGSSAPAMRFSSVLLPMPAAQRVRSGRRHALGAAGALLSHKKTPWKGSHECDRSHEFERDRRRGGHAGEVHRARCTRRCGAGGGRMPFGPTIAKRESMSRPKFRSANSVGPPG